MSTVQRGETVTFQYMLNASMAVVRRPAVGMFGVDKAYAPLSPYYRIPFLILVGRVSDRLAVRDGQVVARPMLTITASLDHRYLDGFHAARLAEAFQEYLADPGSFEPPLEGAVVTAIDPLESSE